MSDAAAPPEDHSSSPSVRLPQLSAGEQPDLLRIERDLRLLGVSDVRVDRHTRMLYATDASLYQVEPIAVVIVGSEEEAMATVQYCHRERLPILPRGGGTALAGQTVNRAVVLDFSARCRKILSVDDSTRRAWVQPGVVLDQLNAHLSPMGLMFGPDVATSSHANLGGMIGNNSAGAYSIRYGRTVEHLVALDVLLADGTRLDVREGSAERDPRQRAIVERLAAIVLPLAEEIDRRFPKIRRHVDGYNLDLLLAQLRASTAGTFDRVNLASLFCGSEGTLGVTLRAELALVERPRVRGLAIISFPSVDAALEALLPILAEQPAAVEMVDDVVIETALLNREHRRTVEMLPSIDGKHPGAVLYVEHFAETATEVKARLQALARLAPGAPVEHYLETADMQRAWRLRKAGEPLLHAIPGERKPITFVEDTAVDPSKLRAFVKDFRAIVERHGTRAAYWAHASVGCLHIRPLVNVRDERDRERMVEIAVEVADLVVRYGGALSGEHGDGRVRTPLLERVMGRELCDAFRQIKAIFDPLGLLNPGNLTDSREPRRILEHHRVRPDDRFVHAPTDEKLTYFRYDREGGFEHAVDQCNGAGICRRLAPGAMCPSYRATLEERHATRGRGNALRLAITGQFSDKAQDAATTSARASQAAAPTQSSRTPGSATPAVPLWRDEGTLETLSLCLSCKACKSECPSNVDIAKLKSEYLAQSFREAGRVPRQARLFGRVRRVSRIGSALWPLVNGLNRVPGVRGAMAAFAGIDPRREPLTFGPSLVRWAARRSAAVAANAADAAHEADASGTHGGSGAHGNASAPRVFLLADCFCAFQEPSVGRASVRLLEAFGYRVEVLDAGCCGRALISTGMLAEASRTCTDTAKSIMAACTDHPEAPVLVCEPSCASAIRDDWLDLRMGISPHEAKSIAERTMLVDEFLDRRWSDHPRRPKFEPLGQRALFHAHCHQKALWGAVPSAALLARLFPGEVEVLDSGCCGMAGSFGYLPQNYDLSMRIGEQSLFGSLRARGAQHAADAPLVIAPGTSCRQQVREALGVEALHPADLCARALPHE